MVVKTDICAFSETKVYPGHGIRFVTRTGQLVVLATSKVLSLYHQKKKPAKLYWTLASRRLHKKLNTEAGIKKRARRVVKVTRGYVGADKAKIEEARKAPKAATTANKTKSGTLIHAAVAEAKARAKAASAAKKASGGAAKAAPQKAAPAKAVAGKGR